LARARTLTNIFGDVGTKNTCAFFSRRQLTLLMHAFAQPQASLQEKPRVFTQTQIASMLLSNLKKIAVMDHGSEVEDCVIGVPVDWTEEQRKILMDAADLAGLKCLSLINENTATALVRPHSLSMS